MGGFGSGRPYSTYASATKSKNKARVLNELRAATGFSVNYNARNPEEEIIPGLQRKFMAQFIKDLLAVRTKCHPIGHPKGLKRPKKPVE